LIHNSKWFSRKENRSKLTFMCTTRKESGREPEDSSVFRVAACTNKVIKQAGPKHKVLREL